MQSHWSGVEHQRVLPEPLESHLKGWLARSSAVVLALLALLGWAALASWSTQDMRVIAGSGQGLRNLLGRPGAIASDVALQLLGLSSLLVVLAALVWSVELGWRKRLAGLRSKLLLLPCAVFVLAGALSALPSGARWPLAHGLGGIGGDLVFQLLARLFAALNPARAPSAAGLVLFAASACLVSLIFGLRRRELGALLPARSGQGTAHDMGPTLPGLRPLGEDRSATAMPPPIPSVAPQFSLAPDVPPRLPPVSTPLQAAPGEPDPPVPEVHIEDEPTDDSSRRMAERFAPRRAPGAMSTGSRLRNMIRVRAQSARDYLRPSLNDLGETQARRAAPEAQMAAHRNTAKSLESVLADFSVKGEITEIRPGPVVTVFELEPQRGTKASRVIGLADDIARSMSVASVRVAVVPGRSVIGIELPNAKREIVTLRAILEAKDWRETTAALPLALGRSISGEPVVMDLARMPHLLVAGTTGSGKSVGINTMILSLLYRHTPADCRFLMIDPKMLELSVYNGIPHLLCPVVTDPHKAAAALGWVVREMEERYKRMAELAVRNLEMYNTRVKNAVKRGERLGRTVQTGFHPETGEPTYETRELKAETFPHIVVVVDEFADLMMVAGKEVEGAVQRLAQMARAAGIHLIMATQRPSVDVVTGTIKSNFPTRISFKVASKIDSRTILNEQGAEQLLGQGDMLLSNGGSTAFRVHGAFVTDAEVERITNHLREQGPPTYIEGITDLEQTDDVGQAPSEADDTDLYERAVGIVQRDQKASTSYLQRRLGIGYNRAADLIERMERDGFIGPALGGGGKRAVLGPRPDHSRAHA